MNRDLNEDEFLVFDYLRGPITETVDKDGITVPSRREYLKPSSSDERRARHALTKILRSNTPVHRLVRQELASLFDPNEESNPRQLKVMFRRRGTRTDSVRDTVIATFIKDEVNAYGSVEAALAAAVKKFGLSRSAVARIWGWKRRTFEALGELKTSSPNKS